MNQVPVRSNGAFGRGLAKLAGANAPSGGAAGAAAGGAGAGCCAATGCAITQSIASAPNAIVIGDLRVVISGLCVMAPRLQWQIANRRVQMRHFSRTFIRTTPFSSVYSRL